jgi:hypothetical protein
VCGRPLAELRLDFPEHEILAYQLTVYPGLICPACRLAITDDRMVKPKSPDLEPSRKEHLERGAGCICGRDAWHLILEKSPDSMVEIDVELWPTLCPDCRYPLAGDRLVQKLTDRPERGAPWRPGRILPPRRAVPKIMEDAVSGPQPPGTTVH